MVIGRYTEKMTERWGGGAATNDTQCTWFELSVPRKADLDPIPLFLGSRDPPCCMTALPPYILHRQLHVELSVFLLSPPCSLPTTDCSGFFRRGTKARKAFARGVPVNTAVCYPQPITQSPPLQSPTFQDPTTQH